MTNTRHTGSRCMAAICRVCETSEIKLRRVLGCWAKMRKIWELRTTAVDNTQTTIGHGQFVITATGCRPALLLCWFNCQQWIRPVIERPPGFGSRADIFSGADNQARGNMVRSSATMSTVAASTASCHCAALNR